MDDMLSVYLAAVGGWVVGLLMGAWCAEQMRRSARAGDRKSGRRVRGRPPPKPKAPPTDPAPSRGHPNTLIEPSTPPPPPPPDPPMHGDPENAAAAMIVAGRNLEPPNRWRCPCGALKASTAGRALPFDFGSQRCSRCNGKMEFDDG